MRKHFKSIPSIGNALYKDGEGADTDQIDRISHLPDEILCHILSFLPTKDALATSVLSTRYKYLFPLIPNPRLVLYDTLIENRTEESLRDSFIKFANLIDRLLHLNLRSIRSLYLTFRAIDDGRQIADWIGALLPLNPKKLDLRVSSYILRTDCLAEKLFGCGLKSLVLCLEGTGYVPEFTCSMPNLKKLRVSMTSIVVVNGLIEGSPLLEGLAIINCTGEDLRIKAPSLRTLRIINELYYITGALELDAPNLTEFVYRGFLHQNHSLTRLTSLEIARLMVWPGIQLLNESQEQAMEVLTACCNVQRLWFSEYLANTALTYSPTLPQFPNLTTAGMTNMDIFGLMFLIKLAKYAPRLCTFYVREGIRSSSCGRMIYPSNSISVSVSQLPDGTSFVLTIHRQAAAELATASSTSSAVAVAHE